MNNFLFINVKGYTIDQAIIAMDEQLKKIMGDPQLAAMQLHSCHFTNGMEMPDERASRISSPVQRPPVMVINCTVLLTEMPIAVTQTEPTEQQKKDLSFAKRFFGGNITEVCRHNRLSDTFLSKVQNGEMFYYRTCQDCGYNVSQDPGNENLPG